jgi:hypothetical protein
MGKKESSLVQLNTKVKSINSSSILYTRALGATDHAAREYFDVEHLNPSAFI